MAANTRFWLNALAFFASLMSTVVGTLACFFFGVPHISALTMVVGFCAVFYFGHRMERISTERAFWDPMYDTKRVEA